jgi:hypothetical protein
MSKSKNTKQLDASLDLELEVGDDAAAYKIKQAEVDEYLADEYCIHCDELLDVFGACLNPDCEANENA